MTILARKFAQWKISYLLFDRGDPGYEASDSLLALNGNDKLARGLEFSYSENCRRSESVLDMMLPGTKFLKRSRQLESADTPLPPFQSSASAVPFQWEEIPGKPKPYDLPIIDGKHSLKLPPRLAVNSWEKISETVADHVKSTEQTLALDCHTLSGTQAMRSTMRESDTKALACVGHRPALSLSLTSAFRSLLSKSFNRGLLKPSPPFTKLDISSHVKACARSQYNLTYNERSFKKFFAVGSSQGGQKLQNVRGLSDIDIWGSSSATHIKCMERGGFENLKCNKGPVNHLLLGGQRLEANKLRNGDKMTSKYCMYQP